MQVNTLVDKIANIVGEPDYTTSNIITSINTAQISISAGGSRPHRMPKVAPLPGLLTSGEVALLDSARIVNLPSDYQRNVLMIIDDTEEIPIIDSYIDYIKAYPTLTVGQPAYCLIRGRSLYYSPSYSKNITVHYYRKPVTVETGDDIDISIPEGLQDALIVSFCCADFFSRTEDEEGDRKNHTSFWKNQHYEALTNLEREIGTAERRSITISDNTSTRIISF